MTAAYFAIVIQALCGAGNSKLLRVSPWSGSSCLGSAVTRRPRRENLVEFATFFVLGGVLVAKGHAASKPPHACLNDLVLQALACGWSKEQADSEVHGALPRQSEECC